MYTYSHRVELQEASECWHIIFDTAPCLRHKHRLIGYKLCLMRPLSRTDHALQAVCIQKRSVNDWPGIGTHLPVWCYCARQRSRQNLRLGVNGLVLGKVRGHQCLGLKSTTVTVLISQAHRGQWFTCRGSVCNLTSHALPVPFRFYLVFMRTVHNWSIIFLC